MNAASHPIASRIAAPRLAALRQASPDREYLEAFVKQLLRDLRASGARVPDEAQWEMNIYLHRALKLENLAKFGRPLGGSPSVAPSVWVGKPLSGGAAAQVTIVAPYLRVDGTKLVEVGLRQAGVEGDVERVLVHPSPQLLEHLHDAVSSSVLNGQSVTRPLMIKLSRASSVQKLVKVALDKRARELFGKPVGEWEYFSSPHEPSAGVMVAEGPAMNFWITLHGLVNIHLPGFVAERTARLRRLAGWPRNLGLAGLLKAIGQIPNVEHVQRSISGAITFDYARAPMMLFVDQMGQGQKINWHMGIAGTRESRLGSFPAEPTSAKNLQLLMAYIREALRDLAPRPPAPSLNDVTRELRGIPLGPGGRARSVHHDEHGWDIEPSNRVRLDHHGNDGEGWDEEGWGEDYESPVYKAATRWLADTFKPGLFEVEVGDKGHVFVSLTQAGKAHFRR